jgi:protein phosphatase
MGNPVEPDMTTIDLQAGDTLLLCTDGVWEPLSDQDIVDFLSDAGPLLRDLERLCEAALEAGGRDNVTAVAARLAATG